MNDDDEQIWMPQRMLDEARKQEDEYFKTHDFFNVDINKGNMHSFFYDIVVAAFLDGEEVPANPQTDPEAKPSYDGKRADKMILTVVMRSQEDVKNMIEYLQIHKNCFDANQEEKL